MTRRLVLWGNADLVFGRKAGSGGASVPYTPAWTDQQFATLKSWGISAIVCQTAWLNLQNGWATRASYFDDPTTAQRAKQAGIDIILGVKLGDMTSTGPPMGGWSTVRDGQWALAATYLTDAAKWIKDAGGTGVAFDLENLKNPTGVNVNWSLTNQDPAAVTARGRQVADALTAGFPGLETLIYYPDGGFPGGWRDVNDPAYAPELYGWTPFWQGVAERTSGQLVHAESIFYKGDMDKTRTWAQSFAESMRLFDNYWSGRLSATQAAKVSQALFNWPSGILENTGTSDDPLPPATVDEALQAGTQARNCIVVYGNVGARDFWTAMSPYVPAMQHAAGVAASTLETVDITYNGVPQKTVAITRH